MRLGIAAESRSDAGRLTSLADRLLVEEVDWFEEEVLDALRVWVGVEGDAFLDLHEAFRRARDRRLAPYGRFAQMHRAALLLFADDEEPPVGVVLGRDLDGQADRARGFDQAVCERPWPFVVIAALAHPGDRGVGDLRLGADELNRAEAARNTEEGARLRPHEAAGAAVLDEFVPPRREARAVCPGRCFRSLRGGVARRAGAPSRGERCGLAHYLRELRLKLVPRLRGRPSPC